MAPDHASLRVLLMQARNDLEIELQEQQCFLERCQLRPDQLTSLNLPKLGKLPLTGSVLDGYDALFIGGAGDFSAIQNYPWMPFALDTVREAYDRRVPAFGSCWGHQLIARALGGTVEHDPDRAEMGCLPVELTPAGESDLLFKDFPSFFLANMGHHDRVTALPDNAIELARNASQPFEAFKMADRPMYGTQFHSELNADRLKARLNQYRSSYEEQLPSAEAYQLIVDGLKKTTEVDHLLFDFLTKFAVVSDVSA